MNILVNVINQKLKIKANTKRLVSGTQKFIRFEFILDDAWDDLLVFAQFIQNGRAYNDYLDENNSVYLPPEIVDGKFNVLLYGSGSNVIATTNYLTFEVDKNMLISDAQSTEITESLYNKLVNIVKTYASQSASGAPTLASSSSLMTDPKTIYLYTGSEDNYIKGDWYYFLGGQLQHGGTYGAGVVDPVPTQDSPNAVSSGGVYETLQIEEHQISPTWIEGGLINKETGEFTESSDTNWTYTQFCEIPRSSKIRLSVYAGGKAAGVAFYDNTETFISGTSVTSKTNTDLREYDVPSNAVFARFTNVVSSNYHPDTPLIILLSDKTDAIFDEIIAKIPQVDAAPTANSTNAVQSGGVKSALDGLQAEIPTVDAVPTQGSSNAVSSGGVYDALQNVDVVEYQISPVWFTGGFIDKQANGAITKSDDANWTYTQFYKIPNTSSKIRLSVYASGKGLGVAFYNSIGTFISGTNITSKSNADLREYDIPTNAVFVRFTNNTASSYHPDTPLIILLRNKTSVILEDKNESEYKQLIWRTGVQLNGAYSASDTRMCTVEPISIDKPTRISLADDWRAFVSYYKNGTWVKDGISSRYTGYVPESGYEIYITLAKRDNSAITDEELATASESIAVILTDQYEEARKAAQYAPNWASVSLFQKIGVLGDSFASGSLHYPDGSGDATTNYAVSWGQILARDTGASVTNYSKGGLSATTWLTNTEYGLEKFLTSDPEQLYICDFGINDWNQRSTYPIGTIADCKEDYTENPQTFYGSYGKIIGNIKDHAPNAKIVMLSVMRNNERQIDGEIEAIAEHFGLPFIKLTDDDFFVSEYYAQSMYGNHPLAHGYAGTAEAVKRLLCKCIMKNADYFKTYYG